MSHAVCLHGLGERLSPQTLESIDRYLLQPLGAAPEVFLHAPYRADSFNGTGSEGLTDVAVASHSIQATVQRLIGAASSATLLALHTQPESESEADAILLPLKRSTLGQLLLRQQASQQGAVHGAGKLAWKSLSSALFQARAMLWCLSRIRQREAQRLATTSLGRFSRIVVSRLDLQWLAAHPQLPISYGEVYVPDGYDWHGVNDVHAIADRYEAEVYLEAEQHISEPGFFDSLLLWRQESRGQRNGHLSTRRLPPGAEHLLQFRLELHGLKIRRFAPVAARRCSRPGGGDLVEHTEDMGTADTSTGMWQGSQYKVGKVEEGTSVCEFTGGFKYEAEYMDASGTALRTVSSGWPWGWTKRILSPGCFHSDERLEVACCGDFGTLADDSLSAESPADVQPGLLPQGGWGSCFCSPTLSVARCCGGQAPIFAPLKPSLRDATDDGLSGCWPLSKSKLATTPRTEICSGWRAACASEGAAAISGCRNQFGNRSSTPAENS
eukprot:TRINITY_DN74486_c0_g1_i1.p1 TRINITY_DN74486_c0_g1~~TRINITY_DN74486_c0_g1_i1.p1  ORF type:complete len:497 (+),score=61.72 TRINITY_DN74486_c0_g1_i1:142-1632(+)